MQVLADLKRLRGKEGSADFLEVVFTRSSRLENGRDVGAWSPKEIGALHLECGVDVACPARLASPGVGGGGVGGEDASLPVSGIVDAASVFVACLRTDRDDALIPTVVCDTSGVALGLVSYRISSSARLSQL